MKIKFLTIIAAIALFSCEAAENAADAVVVDGAKDGAATVVDGAKTVVGDAKDTVSN